MAYDRRCYICGDRLDPGEQCDCKERKQRQKAFWQNRVNVSKNGQASFKFEPERMVI